MSSKYLHFDLFVNKDGQGYYRTDSLQATTYITTTNHQYKLLGSLT